MRLEILGPLAIEADGRQIQLAGGRQRALLAILLLHRGEVVSSERLIEELYGGRPPPSAGTALRAHVSRLRRALGPDIVVATRAGGYALEIGPEAVDSEQFERLVTEGRQLRAAGDPARAAASLHAALGLWRGPALIDFAYDAFAQPEIARLDELRLSALEERIEAELDLGRHDELVGELERLVLEYPLRERLRGQLMLALYRSGRQGEALDEYQETRRKLVEELGIEPGPELQRLHGAILRQEAALEPRRFRSLRGPPAVSARGYDVVLLERDDELALLAKECDAAARGEGRVVLVSGEAGIGKTALVTRFLQERGERARVLFGTCDDLSIPRPLAPIADLRGSVSPALEDALAAGTDPQDIHALLIAELSLPPAPTVLVLEDVHWADEATCDVITVLGRRIGSLPALLVLTFRTGEARPDHPLPRAIGELRPSTSLALELAPLSQDAVASLTGHAAADLYAATGGNPFYVSELLAAGPAADLPASVASSVVARASRLEPAARRLVELVSIVPSRIATTVLDTLVPEWSEAAEEPERRHLLEVEPRWVRFRHELARTAIESSLPIAASRRHHGEILRVLLELDADPADLVHHADGAGEDDDVVGRYALDAARRAAALESNLEAHLYYERALPFIDALPPSERAPVLEDVAWTAYATGRIEDAIAAIRRAIELYETLQNREALGRCTRMLSRFYWWSGDGHAAREHAAHAVAILEPLGETPELARAYSAASQLAALADDAEPALEWGERALALARRLGDERTRAHALVNIGSVELQLDPDAVEALLEAHDVAHAVGDSHEAARALNNLSTRSLWWARPAAALRYAERTVEYAAEHQVHAIGPHAAMLIAWLRLRAGDWIEAERLARTEQSRGVVDVVSATVLTELAVRRGDADAAERLAELRARTERAAELQRLAAAFELTVEYALTSGGPMPTEWIEWLGHQVAPRGPLVGRFAVRIAAWAAVAGLEVDYTHPKGGPYAAMQRCDWQGAADAFGEMGWRYDRALMLSLLDDEGSLGEALDIAQELGAVPLAGRAEGRRREVSELSSTRRP